MGRLLQHDLIGQRFGDLEVMSRSLRKAAYPYWTCRCWNCGRQDVEVASYNLRSGNTRSCGCKTSSLLSASLKGKNTTHGLTQGGKIPPEYNIWRGMMRRCYEKNNDAYSDYGGRGITVCRRWHDFGRFYDDMGPRPSPRHSIDRKEGNEGYSKENCQWATWEEQANNKRNNYIIEFNGRSMTLAQWSREVGLGPATIWRRLEVWFWSTERALTTPVIPPKLRRANVSGPLPL